MSGDLSPTELAPATRQPRWRAIPRDPWDRATAALLVVAALVVAATFRDYGSTWDERFQRQVGEAAVAWWSTGGADTRALEGGETGNLNLYGGLFEGLEEIAASSLPFHPLESRHLVNAVVALLGVAGTALLARRLGGPRAGFLAAALLVATPAWWGHGFANSKDVPFAAPYPWTLLALLRAADQFPRALVRRLLAAGVALGICLASRPGGLILLLPFVTLVVAARALPALVAAPSRVGATAAVAWRLALVLLVAWGCMLVAWPYGLLHPIAGPIEAVAQARTHPWNGLVRFAGGWYYATDLPRSYAPRWFLATLPESWGAIAVAGVAALAVAVRHGRLRPALRPSTIDPLLVAAAGLGPILAAVAMRPVLYDGIRHLLFVLPALAALAGWVLSAALDELPRWGGRVAVGAVGALALLAVVDSVRLHPYQYVYFNRTFAGGLAAASRDYELDYWGASAREAIAWVSKHVATREVGVSVASTADSTVASYWTGEGSPGAAHLAFGVPGQPDLRLASTRWFDHRSTGRTLHAVERMGVPLLYVVDVTPGGAPLVLEAGDLAVALPPTREWQAEPLIGPGVERAEYVLRRPGGGPGELDALVLSPRGGPVPEADALSVEAARRVARLLPGAPERIETTRIDGPGASGWMATRADAGGAAVAAVRVGGAALILSARGRVGSPDPAHALLQWVQGARLAERAERRLP